VITLSEFDKANVGHVLVHGTWWSADLLRLIAKSDPQRLEAIRTAFPDHVAAYEAWCSTPKENTDDDH
jgi:hypothetical protein